MTANRNAKLAPTSSVHSLRGIALFLVPVLIAIAYGNAMNAPFAYDDRPHILENPLVRSFERVFDFPAMNRVFDNPSGSVGRPLLFISYGMNYASSGASPRAFRQINVLIHAVNSFLVFFIVLELANCLETGVQRRFWLAILASALFASHPLLTESVTYIAGRSSALCATFYMVGLYATLRAGREQFRRTWTLLLLTGICAGIGLLVKQDAITLPAACVALIWLAWPSGVSNQRWAASAFLASISLISTAVQFRGLLDVSATTQNNSALVAAGFERTLPFVTYAMTSLTSFSSYYLWRFLIPIRLNVDPQVSTVITLASVRLLASLGVLTCLTVAVFWCRRRRPLLAIGIALVLVSPLSAYCLFPLADVVAEHRAYISAIGAVIIMADLLLALPKSAVISMMLIGLYSWASIERNKVWNDEVLLWDDARRQAPEKIRPHVNLAALYQTIGQADRAIQEYGFVLQREPVHSTALANLASIYLDRNDLEKAEELLNRAIATKSEFPAVYLNLGVVRLRQGRFEEARELFEHALRLNPNQFMAHLDLGDVLFNQGQSAEAIQEYLSEIKLNPDFEMTHIHLAAVYEATGAKEKAIAEYRIAAKLDPANSQVRAALERLK